MFFSDCTYLYLNFMQLKWSFGKKLLTDNFLGEL